MGWFDENILRGTLLITCSQFQPASQPAPNHLERSDDVLSCDMVRLVWIIIYRNTPKGTAVFDHR